MSEKPSYLDENLEESEKMDGRTRQTPGADSSGEAKRPEGGYPGDENRADRNFERPDEFGDGDRRS